MCRRYKCYPFNSRPGRLKGSNIQGDSKPLRQVLRVDRANNKEQFLLNNLCLLTHGFKENTGDL